MYNFDGKVKNCIRSVDTQPIGDIKDQPIEQIVLGQENVNRQTKIVQHQPVVVVIPVMIWNMTKKDLILSVIEFFT
jgi:hypothetical protein